jgi:hypothetical protein
MKPRLSSQVLVGLMVIAVGVIFTLDNLGIIYSEDYLRYWPAVFVLIGGVKVWQARTGGHGQGWVSGLIFLGVGSYMLINHLTYIRLDARVIFPLFLVFLGGFLVWRGVFGRRGTLRASSDALNHFSSLAVMSGAALRSNSQAFEGADLTAIMGGCEIDLRDASIAPNTQAVIDVFAFWGGIDLKVPEDWIIINRVIPLMGGVDDKTRAPIASSAPQKRLVVRGIVIMGGIGIRNRSRRDDFRDRVDEVRKMSDDIHRSVHDTVHESIRDIRQSLRDDDRRR